jgi:hypothetical protein
MPVQNMTGLSSVLMEDIPVAISSGSKLRQESSLIFYFFPTVAQIASVTRFIVDTE